MVYECVVVSVFAYLQHDDIAAHTFERLFEEGVAHARQQREVSNVRDRRGGREER